MKNSTSPEPTPKQTRELPKELPKYAATLALTEIGLGSLLHALSIPLAGHFLSLNQGLILSRATWQSRQKTAGSAISTTVAILKSLSPAGKKLTPMLAISVQGILFSLGTLLFGPGLPGALLGMVLLSIWGFAQPVLLYLLIFGKTGVDLLNYFVDQLSAVITITPGEIGFAVFALLALKAIVGSFLVTAAWYPVGRQKGPMGKASLWIEKTQTQLEELGQRRATAREQSQRAVSPWKGALQDLSHPLFLISIGLASLFFWVTGETKVAWVWNILRFFAVAFLLYFAARWIPLEKIKSPLLRETLQTISGQKTSKDSRVP